jgi:hypothetical protein
MTDARFPDRWLNDRRLLRLTDRAHRGFICALVWSVSNHTDGEIEPEDLSLIHGFSPGCEDELVASKLWIEIDHGWRVVDFADTQTSAAEHEALSKARLSNRERQARWRAKKASSDSANADDNVQNNVTHNVQSNAVTKTVTTQDRLGQARQGFASPSLADDKEDINTSSNSLVLKDESSPESGTSPEPSDRVRGTRIPEDWKPSDAVRDDLRGKYPNAMLGAILVEFCDYWRAIPGQRGRKADWDATFRNRVREVAHLPRFQRTKGQLSTVQNKAMNWQAEKNYQPQQKELE